MTTKADYTEDEWNRLLTAPRDVGLGVMLSDRSGPIGAVQELVAIFQAVRDTTDQGAGNELVRAVAADLVPPEDSPEADREREPLATERPRDAAQARAQVLDALRAVAALLAAKSTPQEADGFARWLLSIGGRVAEAAKEGGFLGFGGTRVSDKERAMLDEIAAALGVRR